jgi:tetrahydromethanopterin S-methyltransferase subunit G
MITIQGEERSLRTHVSLCQERYLRLEARIDKIELKLNEISQEISQNKADLSRVLIGATSTILAGLLGLITTILFKF